MGHITQWEFRWKLLLFRTLFIKLLLALLFQSGIVFSFSFIEIQETVYLKTKAWLWNELYTNEAALSVIRLNKKYLLTQYWSTLFLHAFQLKTSLRFLVFVNRRVLINWRVDFQYFSVCLYTTLLSFSGLDLLKIFHTVRQLVRYQSNIFIWINSTIF